MCPKRPQLNKVYSLTSFLFFLSLISNGQSTVQAQKIKEALNISKIELFTSNLEKNNSLKQAKIANLATTKGWKISETTADGNYSELQDIGPDGTPLYYTTFNDNVSKVSRADAMHDNGLLGIGINGEGMKVGIWDAGAALTTHQEFDTRVIITDNTSEIASHATMVLGTMVASGVKAKAKGVAYKANAITNDWRKDKIEVTHAASEGLLLSNHSYGIKSDRVPDWYFGSYIRVSQEWDNIMYNLPYYLMVTAAGNTQRLENNQAPLYGKSADGYDLMLGFTASKNGITVAAADTEIDSKGNILDATIAPYSSFGPVDDGRIKPDIAGSGTNIFSTNSSGEKSYDTFSGTSMASPGVTASMLLLQQYYEKLNANYMKAATLKGLTLHTADDVNEKGPDYKMGWGIMNAKKAAELITNIDYSAIVSEEKLKDNESYSITVNTDGKTPLIASISWTDPASEHVNEGILNDTTPALVNDLDIRITDEEGNIYLPWKLSASNANAAAKKGDNRVDPFERIEIDAPKGTYTITISHKNNLKNKSQNFSLIVSGIRITDCIIDQPNNITLHSPIDTAITLKWEKIKDAFYEVQYKQKNTADWSTLYTDENNISLENLKENITYEIQVRTYCTENIMSDYSSKATFTFNGEKTDLSTVSALETYSSESELQYSIFPNPVAEYINLDGNLSNECTYNIVNIAGVVVKKGTIKEKQINIINLPIGLYVLTVTDKNETKSTKFYKN